MTRLIKELLSSTKLAPLALVGGLVMGTFGAVQARADTTDELLELLRRKGAISKKEYVVIKTRHAAEKTTRVGGPLVKGDGDHRYVLALDKGIGVRIPGTVTYTKEGSTSVGDVDVTISGNLNAFYVEQFSGGVRRGALGAASIGAGLTDPTRQSAAVRGGLLPAAVVLDIATRQEGYDISGTIGIYTGINNINTGLTGLNADGTGFAKSLGTPGVNIKLAYLKVGTGFGTFEAGRDFGLFGQDILTFDQNELAVGGPGNNLAPTQNALGNLGLGYIVSDFIPQFRYTTPNYNGFTATFAVETPYDATTFGAVSGTSGGGTIAGVGGLLAGSSGGFAHDQPQFAGRVKYVGNILPNAMLTAWAGGMTQELQGIRAAFPAGAILAGGRTSFRAYAGEAGAKIDVGAAELLGYGYYGKGVGTTALFFDGLDEQGNGRKSYGFLAQASYTFFDRLTVAGGYGWSFLEHTAFDVNPGELPFTCNAFSCNVKYNLSYTGTVRYKVTKWLNLIGQYVHQKSKALDGTRIDSDAAVAGAQIFF